MTRRLRERVLRHLSHLAQAREQEGGYVTILLAILFASGFLMAAAATSVDTSRWYDEINRVQKAADAAALAGVPYMPYDFANATTRAREVAARNGYSTTDPTVTITVSQGTLASQLVVTVTHRLTNAFGSVIGVPNTTISRSATADYKGPAPMGSPCNTFGNEPTAGNNSASATPAGSAQFSGTGKFSNCTSAPQFWATVEGPETQKLQGDRYQTRNCGATSGVDGCSGNTNTDYDSFGYVFLVKVQPNAVNTDIKLQLFDPAFAYTGTTCSVLPATSAFPTNDTTAVNDYVKSGDAKVRYTPASATSSPSQCPGDYWPGSNVSASNNSMWTTFVLRQQVDSLDPMDAAVQKAKDGTDCVKQYGSYAPAYSSRNNPNRNWDAGVLTKGNSLYNDELSRQFHNWVDFCTFRPTRAGDYYLQVRTNIAPSGTGTLIRSGTTSIASADTGSYTTGTGDNSFGIRAVTGSGLEQQVAVSGYDRMPIFINSAAAATFNLIRVLPGAAGQSITFSYYDAGDAQSDGSVQVIRPGDATGSITTTPFPNGGCKASGGSAPSTPTAISDCKATIVSNGDGTSKNNGKVETITIPIPTDYNCDYSSFGGCWYQVRITFGSGNSAVNDITTWDATIIGDPVRLIK